MYSGVLGLGLLDRTSGDDAEEALLDPFGPADIVSCAPRGSSWSSRGSRIVSPKGASEFDNCCVACIGCICTCWAVVAPCSAAARSAHAASSPGLPPARPPAAFTASSREAEAGSPALGTSPSSTASPPSGIAAAASGKARCAKDVGCAGGRRGAASESESWSRRCLMCLSTSAARWACTYISSWCLCMRASAFLITSLESERQESSFFSCSFSARFSACNHSSWLLILSARPCR
mmetsp:Transcript_27338/g.78726  ORF Transcript_27338/g.78726 Transcript_27338/m.78726 type:complete len:235 (+) Transcript_27338:1485-2189(+)